MNHTNGAWNGWTCQRDKSWYSNSRDSNLTPINTTPSKGNPSHKSDASQPVSTMNSGSNGIGNPLSATNLLQLFKWGNPINTTSGKWNEGITRPDTAEVSYQYEGE